MIKRMVCEKDKKDTKTPSYEENYEKTYQLVRYHN